MKRNKSLGRALLSVVVAIAMLGTGITILNDEPIIKEAAAAPGFTSVLVSPNPVEFGDSATLEVLVYDADGVANVTYRLDWYNTTTSTWNNNQVTYGTYWLSGPVGNVWTGTIPASELDKTGYWRCRARATNTTGTYTDSGFEYFYVNDTTGPDISNLDMTGMCVGEYANITVDVTDESGIANVYRIWRWPSGQNNQSMTPLSGDTYYWQRSITWDCSFVGDWFNVSIAAEDNEGNWNTYGYLNMTVQDCEDPTITNFNVTQNTSCYGDAWVNITVDITDNCGVGTIHQVNYTNATGSGTWTLTQIGATSTYYTNQTFVCNDIGTWTVHIYVNDTNGNTNTTPTKQFVLWDNYNPTFGTIVENDIELCTNWTINATIMDDCDGVAGAQVNITGPGGAAIVPLTLTSGNSLSGTWAGSWHPPYIGTYTYHVYAWDLNSTPNDAESASDTFLVTDTTPPVITNVIDTPDPVEYCTSINITADVTDCGNVTQVNLTIDLGPPVTFPMTHYSGTTWYYNYHPPAPGPYGYFIEAWDESGNYNWTHGVYAFNCVDTTPPTINWTLAIPDPVEFCNNVTIFAKVWDHWGVETGPGNVTITIGGDGPFNMEYDLGTGNWSYEYHPSAPGLYTYLVEAWDRTGLYNNASGTFAVSDTTSPEWSDLIYDPEIEFCTWDNISINITDHQGVANNVTFTYDSTSVYMTLTAGDIHDGTWSYDWHPSAPGMYTCRIEMWDVDGNYNATGLFTIWVNDTTPPTITVTDWPDPLEYCNDIYINATVWDHQGIDRVEFVIDGYGLVYTDTTAPYQLIWHPPAVGTYTYNVTVYDPSGNSNYATGSFLVQDTTPPTINWVTAIPDTVEYCTNVTILTDVWDHQGVDHVNVTITGPMGTVGPFTMNLGYFYIYHPPQVGTYTYTITAYDLSGNMATDGGSFDVVDTTPPTIISVVDAPDPLEYCNDITITVTATDHQGVDYVEFVGAWGTATVSTVPYEFTWHPPAPGTYPYTVNVYDLSGNMATDGGSFDVVDTTAPAISNVDAQPDPLELCNDIYISADVTDHQGVDYVEVTIVPGGTFTMSHISGDTYGYYYHPPSIGTYTYTVYAYDLDSNMASDGPHTFDVVDTTPPSITDLTETPDPAEYCETVTISATITDCAGIGSVTITIELPDGTPLPPDTMTSVGGDVWEYTYHPEEYGTYQYTIYAEDTNGNGQIAIGCFAMVVEAEDTTPPEILNVMADPSPVCLPDTAPVEVDITITADVTDNVMLGDVWVNIGGTDYTMTNIGGDTYQYVYTADCGDIGVTAFTVYADDVPAGNVGSAPGSFEVNDCTDPVITNVMDTPDPILTASGPVTIDCNVDDNCDVDTVELHILVPTAATRISEPDPEYREFYVGLPDDPTDVDYRAEEVHTMVDGGGGYYYYDYTPLVDGIYEYWIEATDTSGNSVIAEDADGEYDADAPFWFVASSYFWDVGVDGLVNLTDGGQISTVPRYIDAILHNYGIGDYRDMDVDVHLQIYEEIPIEPEEYQCWDMEYCHLNTFIVEDGNGDGVTWYWTEKRSHSPTHSFHSQPDYLDTYEAYSEDYFGFQDWFHIPTEKAMDSSSPVVGAWLNFSHWCEGEFVDPLAYDYGMVYIEDAAAPGVRVPIGGPYYSTDGEWRYEEIDISAYIGHDIKIWFGWFADGTVNYEGWYIDDICIKLAYGSLQPLIFQGYKFTNVLGPYCTQWIIQFPIEWDPKPDTTYFIQVYVTNYWDENPVNDVVNYTIYFGDICDGAVLDVNVDPEFEMPDTSTVPGEDYINIPITATVYNNGTLAEEIPVKVSARHLITDKIYFDDVEDEDMYDLYDHGNFGGTDYWGVTGFDFYSPYNSWGFMDSSNHYGGGTSFGYWIPPPDYVDWGEVWHDENFDIVYKMKWNLNDNDNLGVWMHCGNYIITLSSSFLDDDPYVNYTNHETSWTDVSLREVLAGYMAGWGVDTLAEMGQFLCDIYGFTFPDQFYGFGWIMHGDAYGVPTNGLLTGPWSGVLIDDIYAYSVHPGEEVWSDVNTTELLAPGDTAVLGYEWNTTEYCDYIITATVILDCDQDPNNNEASTTTRIYEQIYENEYESATTDDNTYGLPDDWRIVEECSMCPEDHFWHNGITDDAGLMYYQADADDVLMMLPYEDDANGDFVDVLNKTFDFTAPGYYNFTFDAWWSIELWWDYCLLEISNDAGLNWYPIYEFTDEGDWQTIALTLYDPFGTGICQQIDSGGWIPGTLDLLPDLYSPWPRPAVPATDEMQLRFHMISDAGTEQKGIMIDDVSLVYNDLVTIFADDMESGDGNWEHMRDFTGDLWHEESFYWICADTYYSWYNAEPSGDYSFYPTQWFVYDETDAGLYRNNMDDKLILSFDLTHAYEAFLEWDQMTGFAGMYPDDYGVVEIWTDGAWKALFIVQGDTLGTWGHMKLDISDYVGGDEFTQVRFRLISNESIVGDGWAVANFSIQGKVDFVNPTCAISLSPATPNGNHDWYTSAVTVTVTGTDNRKVETLYYRIDGGAWKTYSAPFSINIDGEHTVEAYVVDDVGNPSDIRKVTFKIDATAPTVSIDTPQSGYIYFMGRELFKNPLGGTIIIGGITFAATASDAMSGLAKVSFDIDGYSYEKTSSPYEVWWHKFDLLPTKYTLSVSAEDNAGNTASAGTIDFTHWL